VLRQENNVSEDHAAPLPIGPDGILLALIFPVLHLCPFRTPIRFKYIVSKQKSYKTRKMYARNADQGEAIRRKCKALKLGSGQIYDRSSECAAVIMQVRKVKHSLLYKTWTDKVTLYIL